MLSVSVYLSQIFHVEGKIAGARYENRTDKYNPLNSITTQPY